MQLLLTLAVIAAVMPMRECTFTNFGRLQGIYMGWAGHANLGDELVLDIFGHLLRDTLLQPGLFQQVRLEYQHPFSTRLKASFNFSAYSFAVLGGGSLLETSYTSRTPQCEGVRKANVPMFVFGTGTQLPYTRYDGRNLRCIQPPIWGGVRGPLTNALLENMAAHFKANATQYQLPVYGDSGILADRIFPRVSWGIVGSLDKAKRAASSDPVLCVSGVLQFGTPNTTDFLETSALIEMWARRYIVVLLPVDPSTAKRQEPMYEQSLSSKRVAEGRLFFNAHISHYGVWLALLSRCDLVLTVRLHAAVMAAAAGTPFIMPYGKEISKKARDFLLGTVGKEMLEEFFVRQSEFDGSVAAVAGLLRQAQSRGPRQRAAFSRAIAFAHSSYMGSLRTFVDEFIPDSYRAFTDVLIKISRYHNSALFDLTFE